MGDVIVSIPDHCLSIYFTVLEVRVTQHGGKKIGNDPELAQTHLKLEGKEAHKLINIYVRHAGKPNEQLLPKQVVIQLP